MLYSYKMTNDVGFAPNPFHRVLTLATCKPQIRATKKVGDLIAGFSSKSLNGDDVGRERLVYIMKVTAITDYDSYFRDKRFKLKKASRGTEISTRGDNIYYTENGTYKQALTFFHKNDEEIEHDLGSDKVLISNEFFYFGQAAIPVDRFGITIPKGQSAYGVKTKDPTKVEALWDYLRKTFKKNIPIGPPHFWRNKEQFKTSGQGCCQQGFCVSGARRI